MAIRYSRGTSQAGLQAKLLQQQQREQDLQKEKEKEEADTKRKRRSTTIIIVVITIIVLVAVGVALYFFVFRKSATGTTTNTGQTTSGTAVGGTCQNNNTCATSLICSGGVCKKQPQATCAASAECPINYSCVDNKCQGRPTGVCSNNNDCQQPLACKDQTCQIQTCTSQASCTHGGQCNTAVSKCLAPLTGFCTSTSDCAPPYECNTTTNKCEIKQCPAGNTDCGNVAPLPGDTNIGFCSNNSNPPVCIMGPNATCIQDQQCDVDPLGAPPGLNAIQKCDPATKQCRLLGGQTCGLLAPVLSGKCLNGATCGPPFGFLTGICTCNANNECNPLGPTPACDTIFSKCVQCTSDANCTIAAPNTKCNVQVGANVCVLPCTSDPDCTDAPYNTCNIAGGYCVV